MKSSNSINYAAPTQDAICCHEEQAELGAIAEMDEALEPQEPKKEKWESLTKLLRWLGGIVLIASAVTLVVQNWEELSSLNRYFCFLAFTTALSGIGFFCGLRMKDDKGARTLLGISTAFLPAHFTQLGALVFAFILGKAANVPELLRFDPTTPIELSITLAAAYALLVPVVFAGFSSLARAEASKLTIVYLLANSVLLIPTREATLIAFIAAALFSALLYADRKFFAEHSAMKTWEGYASRLLLFVPFAVLLGRNILLHPSSEVLFSLLAAIAAFGLFSAVPRVVKDEGARYLSQAVSVPFAAAAWLLFIDGVYFSAPESFLYALFGNYRQELLIPLFALPVALIITAMSFFAIGGGKGYRKLAANVAILPMLLQLVTVEGIFSSSICIITAIVVIVSAFMMEEKGLLYIGVFGFGIGTLYHLRYAWHAVEISPWLTLAVTGTLIVLASSYIEKNHREMLARGKAIRERVSSWS